MQSKHYRKLQVGVIAQLFLLISWGCSDSRSFFVSEVNEVAEPEEVIDLDLEKLRQTMHTLIFLLCMIHC